MKPQVPSLMTNHPPLTGGYVDRDARTREADSTLDEAWAEPTTRLLRIRDGLLPLSEHNDSVANLDLVRVSGARQPHHWYLGRLDGAAMFAVNESTTDGPEPAAGWIHPFEFGGSLSAPQAELMSIALALAAWNGSEPFSARSGEATTATLGGWARLDENGVEHFPRTDPVIIVLIEDGDRLLLGSNVLWESGRFSLLAGFVEAGESAEHAVAREVWEESSLRVGDIEYVTSQPWPFPRSLMFGFRARPIAGVDPDDLVPDPSELSELRWFTRDELRNPPPGIRLPMPMSIARYLIELWIAEGDSGSSV